MAKTKECTEEKEKRCLFFPFPWEFQTPFSALRATDPFLLLQYPGFLINLPRNWLSHPFSFYLPSFPASFSNEPALLFRWPKYGSFSFSISPSNEYSGFISFGTDWFDLLAAQGTLKHLLQHHNSKESIIWHSAFFMVQLSHPYRTNGKTIALIIRPLEAKWCICFLIYCLGCHSFLSKEQTFFNSMTAVTVHHFWSPRK